MSILVNEDTVTLEGHEYTVQTPGLPWSLAVDESLNYVRMELRKGNQRAGDLLGGSGVERCELRGPHVPLTSDDVWFSFALRVTGNPSTNSGVWTILGQLQQRPEAGEVSKSPTFSQYIVEGAFKVLTRSDPAVTTTAPVDAVERFSETWAADSRWHHYVYHLVFDPTGTSGVMEGWKDGTKFLDATGQLGYNDVELNSQPDFKIGIYRQSQTPRVVVEYANVELDFVGGSLEDRILSPLSPPPFTPWSLY